jgi:hypothetical protein
VASTFFRGGLAIAAIDDALGVEPQALDLGGENGGEAVAERPRQGADDLPDGHGGQDVVDEVDGQVVHPAAEAQVGQNPRRLQDQGTRCWRRV